MTQCRRAQSHPAFQARSRKWKRFHANEKEIVRCLNFKELVPYLCERAALLSFEEGHLLLNSSLSRSDQAELLFRKMEKKVLTSYSTFLDCLQREESHLGHTYVRSLLEGRLRQYASESDIAHSEALKNAVVNSYTEFTKGINLTELFPHMSQYRLLTEHEKEYICNTQHTTIERIMFFFHVLDTKGALAYGHFANCLRDEHSHLTHNQLFTMMYMDVEKSQTPKPHSSRQRKRTNPQAPETEATLCKRTPHRLRFDGSLKSKWSPSSQWRMGEARSRGYKVHQKWKCSLWTTNSSTIGDCY